MKKHAPAGRSVQCGRVRRGGRIHFDYGGRTFAICRNHAGQYGGVDGLCTHEELHPTDGLLIENTIECSKHSSVFDFTTGVVETPSACEDLRTCSVRVENGRVMIEI